MTTGPADGSNSQPGIFQPRTDPEAVLSGEDSGRFTTAARALVLGNALASAVALQGLDSDIAALGFQRLPEQWGGWESRIEAVGRSDAILAQEGLLESVRAREASRIRPAGGAPLRQARLQLWQRASGPTATPADAIAWLRSVMTDEESLGATAAASALSHWRRTSKYEVPVAFEAARDLVGVMQNDADRTAAAIAQASNNVETARAPRRSTTSAPPSHVVGTVVHGTFAYPTNWWYPGGDFHTFAQQSVCSPLYNGGSAFDWSGAYRAKHRTVAAQRFAKWVEETSPNGLCCVFAHSYGGSVVLESTTYGTHVNQLVLLSTPVDQIPTEWRNIGRTVSLRIHADLVLLAARRRQLFTENVEEHHLPRWFVSHSDSHSPSVWQSAKAISALKLTPH